MTFRNSALAAVNGPDSTRAANKIRQLQDAKTQWPYPWEAAPPNAKNRLPFGSIPCPAGGVLTQIMQFTVPTGMRFYLKGILNQFEGAGLVLGSGNALWTLDRDTPIGSSFLPALVIADFYQQPFTLGNFNNGPFPFAMPEVFEAGAVIRSKVITDGTITPGAPNYFVTLLYGYTVPAE
jgi:hypothetical protein